MWILITGIMDSNNSYQWLHSHDVNDWIFTKFNNDIGCNPLNLENVNPCQNQAINEYSLKLTISF